MNKEELKEIIKRSVREVISEFFDINDLNNDGISSDSSLINDPSQPHVDDMSIMDKEKRRRDLEKQRRDKIKSNDLDLKITKRQSDYFTKQLEKNKMDVIAKEKELQKLKSTRI